MKEVKCTIIQDVLPLYIDEVVSQDTKEMVDEHLQHCDKCQKEYESMKRDLYIPVENKAPIIQKINKKWRKKKVIISFASIFATAIILLGAYLCIFYYERVIPYSKNLFKIEMQNDKQLASHYFGESYSGVTATYPRPIEINGEKKNVSFIFYKKLLPIRLQGNLLIMKKVFMNKNIFLHFLKVEKLMLCIMWTLIQKKSLLERILGIQF